MAERLFDVQTGLAAEALIDGQNERAVKALDAALALRPDAAPVVRVRNALDDLMTTDAADAGTARGSLWEALVAYAEPVSYTHLDVYKRQLDGRSDLYSLGALFYRCLVGRPPFTGSTTQILHAHVYEPLMIPDAVVAALPEAAVEILRRVLAKEPATRYATGDEMALAFERLLASTPTNVPPTVESTATMPALAVVRPPTTMQVLSLIHI